MSFYPEWQSAIRTISSLQSSATAFNVIAIRCSVDLALQIPGAPYTTDRASGLYPRLIEAEQRIDRLTRQIEELLPPSPSPQSRVNPKRRRGRKPSQSRHREQGISSFFTVILDPGGPQYMRHFRKLAANSLLLGTGN